VRINLIQPLANLAGGVKSGRLLMEALHRRGHDVQIIFPARPALPRDVRPATWWWWWRAGRAVRSGAHHLASSTATLLPVERAAVRASDVPDADITIANFWQCREWMEGWPARTGVPALFVRGHFRSRGQRERIDAAIRGPGVNFAPSAFLRNWLATEHGDPNAILVYNGLDPRFDSPPRDRQAAPTIGYMFQVGERKGSDTALRAIEQARRAFPDLRVLAFGATPPDDDWPLPEGAEFHLRPPQEKIPELYRQCDVWLLPSRQEGFAMPGLEAFGSHTPVVSTLCGGPDEYIDEGVSGYLVPVEDHEAMAERAIEILRMPNDRWREMSEAGYRRSREFSWDRSGELMEQAIYRILSGEHPIRT
jgi:glycosyltransferase involved in cell wall biosynthesis